MTYKGYKNFSFLTTCQSYKMFVTFCKYTNEVSVKEVTKCLKHFVNRTYAFAS
ncbi:hypothetical protein MSIBF_A1460020 [groundwater metagenome]|uniref:Uncharacterized protein n=1 Tax=groundwater metagenome TaxID=717931 RepID=A0A098E7H0_9ZZZZ